MNKNESNIMSLQEYKKLQDRYIGKECFIKKKYPHGEVYVLFVIINVTLSNIFLVMEKMNYGMIINIEQCGKDKLLEEFRTNNGTWTYKEID